MPKTKRRGPLSPQDAAENYAVDLYGRLRIGRGWRANTSVLLKEEYSSFGWARVAGGTFGIQTMWEYYQLVYATTQYLRANPDPVLARYFLERAADDLLAFKRQREEDLHFDPREEESMQQAQVQSILLMRKWKETAEGARG